MLVHSGQETTYTGSLDGNAEFLLVHGVAPGPVSWENLPCRRHKPRQDFGHHIQIKRIEPCFHKRIVGTIVVIQEAGSFLQLCLVVHGHLRGTVVERVVRLSKFKFAVVKFVHVHWWLACFLNVSGHPHYSLGDEGVVSVGLRPCLLRLHFGRRRQHFALVEQRGTS